MHTPLSNETLTYENTYTHCMCELLSFIFIFQVPAAYEFMLLQIICYNHKY